MYCSLGKPATQFKVYKQSPVLNESIYNLIPKLEVRQEKPIRYQSIYSNSVKEFYESKKMSHKTMGYYRTPLAPPKEYLRKHNAEIKKQPLAGESKSFSYPDQEKKKPPVPKHDERASMPDVQTKNFLKENKRNVARAVARKPVRKVVDTRKGDAVLLEFSGLVPKYSQKKEFGKTPKYLVLRQEDMAYSRKAYDDFVKKECTRGAPEKIFESERVELLAALKERWSELNQEYLSLPVVMDTLRKKSRKESIEEKLRILEQDITLLERHTDIYIVNYD